MTTTDVLVGLAIVVGLAGILIPLLPGTLLVFGAVLAWALVEQSATGWVVFGVAGAVLGLGGVAKYVVPKNRMSGAGVPTRTLVIGGLCGVVGLFVIPYVGLFVGFVLGVYAAEWRRVGSTLAWPSTKQALKAVGVSLLIEATAGLLAAFVWTVGVIAS